ncbi:MAG: MmgE/PrpD family protein, partial [Casimicrobiaceae bacterium]
DMAAIIGARDEPEVACVHARMLARAKVEEATIFRGGRARTDRLSAIVANGIAADWLELDEGYRLAPCHAGLYTVPALLAECEANDVAFGDMLRALVVGYEVATRVARTWVPSAYVMQAHGRYAAVGAAAAVARARNADADLLRAAITGAVTLITAAPRDHLASGAMVRNVWAAVGSWAGTMSVEWAECGIGGVDSGFYDVYSTVHGGTASPERLITGLGSDWAILDGYMKIYACCQHLHSTVEALLGMDEAPVDEIAEIMVATHPLALPLMNPRPTTTLGAKFSLPHAVAAVLVKRTGGADAFTSTTLDDPRIAGLRDLVRVLPYAPLPNSPNDRPAHVTIRYRDGRQVNAECLSAQGGSDRPFTPGTFVEKITALTTSVYPKFVPVFQELMRADGDALAKRWPSIVGEITA